MKRICKLAISIATALLIGLLSNTANAGTVSGHITSIFVSLPNNLPFRISVDTPTPDCPSGILYVDGSSANYQVYVSALMLAYSQSKTVGITYTAGTAGFCSIVEFVVS